MDKPAEKLPVKSTVRHNSSLFYKAKIDKYELRFEER